MAARSFLLGLLLGTGVQAANLCFFPGGVQARDVPCDPSADVSMCCGSVAACLSNGLCKDSSTTNNTGVSYARGTCTDPTWQSPICPQNCQLNQDTARNSSAFDFRFNGVQVWECNAQGFGTPADYCCESASEKTRCCATQSALFTLRAATQGNALALQTFSSGVASVAATTTAAQSRSLAASTSSSLPATQAPLSSTAAKTSSKPLGSSSVAALTTSAGATSSAASSVAASPGSSGASSTAKAPLADGSGVSSNLITASTVTPSSTGGSSGGVSQGPTGDRKSNGLSTGSVVAIGVGASISSAVLVGSAVIFILKRSKANEWNGTAGNGSYGGNNRRTSSFYGGPPIYAPGTTKGEMAQRDRTDGSDWYDTRKYGPETGRPRLHTAELNSLHEAQGIGGRHTSPTISALDHKTSPGSRGARHPGSKIFELA